MLSQLLALFIANFLFVDGELTKHIFTPGLGCGTTNEITSVAWSEDGNPPCSLATKIETLPEAPPLVALSCSVPPTAIDGTTHEPKFPLSSALTDDCDGSLDDGSGNMNYWLPPNVSSGFDVTFIVFDLGCVRVVSKVRIKSAWHTKNRSNRDISLWCKQALSEPDWTLWAEATMTAINNSPTCADVPYESFTFDPVDARYIRFVVESYFRYGGGLQFIEFPV